MQKICNMILRALALCCITVAISQPGGSQTLSVLHNFTGGLDGAFPKSGVTMDLAGNLYGTTLQGGSPAGGCNAEGFSGCGTVFKLARSGSGWIFKPLYAFGGHNDGAYPLARVVFGLDGTLYGTTVTGGEGSCSEGLGYPGCGTIFRLRPASTFCRSVLCLWNETVLYRFTGQADGGNPGHGDLIFDRMGNIYGTTQLPGPFQFATVFQLTQSGGTWNDTVLYSFTDGSSPYSGVIFNAVGSLYGTAGTAFGGEVFQLTYTGSQWLNTVIYRFGGGDSGDAPEASLISDSSGNLYGTTSSGGQGGGGTVYELTPSGNNWIFSVLYSFEAGFGPAASLTMDGDGALYGTTVGLGAYRHGSVFKLTPSSSGWIYTDLHDFTGGADGDAPEGNVIVDTNGNIYGSTSGGGTGCFVGCGVIWEITP